MDETVVSFYYGCGMGPHILHLFSFSFSIPTNVMSSF